MVNVPSIVIVSCSNTKPKSLIKLITNGKTVQDADSSGLIKHPWLIDTKYYTAEVNILGLERHYLRTEEFNRNVEALIVHTDCNKHTGLEDLKEWEGIQNDCNLEVKLLVSNYCNDGTRISRDNAMAWCLEHGFEFIELYPTINKSQVEDEIIKEKFGVDRIVEALQNHTWSNLIMKEKPKTTKKKSKVAKEEQSSSNSSNAANAENILTVDAENILTVDAENILTDDATDDFTELFSQLHLMKESLQNMPLSQRTQCAEQMVTAFWKAIGGEEEEILDL